MAVNLQIPSESDIFPVAGVEIGVTEAGIRKANRRDLTVFQMAAGTNVAGVFTRNRFRSEPVQVCEANLPAGGPLLHRLVNNSNATAGTGTHGPQQTPDPSP